MVVRLHDDGFHADGHQQLDLRSILPHAGQPGHWAQRVYGNKQPPGIQASAVLQAGNGLGLVGQLLEEEPATNAQHPASSQHAAEQSGPMLERFEDVLRGLTSNADLPHQSSSHTAEDTAEGIQRLEERLGTIETQLDQLQGDPSREAHILVVFY